MRLTAVVFAAIACACSRPPAASTEPPGGLELRQVKLDAWRGGKKTLSGTAPRVSLQRSTFEASDVQLEPMGGSRVEAASLSGDSDGRRVDAPQGGVAHTHDGCVAKTKSASRYDGAQVRVDGNVTFDGCGIALEARGLTYSVADRHAQFDGPVQTRIEAQP